MYISARIQHSI